MCIRDRLKPYPIYDAAAMFSRNMYVYDSLFCISFSSNKNINIGKGGMILTNDSKAVEWFKLARYMGRHEGIPHPEDNFEMLGWNMIMTPEQAARGLQLVCHAKDHNEPKDFKYPDLSKFKIYQSKETAE